MKQTLDKIFEPQKIEDSIYERWEESGYFNPDKLPLPETAPTYTIVLPPPNITAHLHMGHSAMLAIEDLLIRYHRMNGYRTLWIPGTDHAAIATQMVVEKRIFQETGLTRHDLGRPKLLEEIWKFLSETQSAILYQTKKMGSSLDWSRTAFTLDEPRQKAVVKMFADMYREGAIYRGERIVNWCPHCHSTLADDEVEYREQTAKLYTFKYSADFPLAISTTRPETKLGDTAVAVNPKDERYRDYIGREYSVIFCGQPLKIKIIADRNVEMDFGTGALGVTPAHSMVDWKIAEENNLEIIKVIDENGLIKDGFGRFSGLTVVVARQQIVADLEKAGLIISTTDLINNLSICYRCETAIEPLPSKQWFVAVDKPLERLGGKSLKEKSLAAAVLGDISFVPERFNKRFQDWMNNLHDWCISRQIWFGHRIPVWYRGEEIYCGETEPKGNGWQQDPDTLDTWFSSSMWTFSTLGWPDNFKDGRKSGDLARFHPTQVLETGYEIITLWVSRMIMMSFFALGEIPFQTVYLHGMILDKNGKKMSKTKGNGIDPLESIEKYGADATRLSLLTGSTPGNDTRYSEEKIEAKRNFINKLWNIARFIITLVDPDKLAAPFIGQPVAKTLADKWILGELAEVSRQTRQLLDNFDFSSAADLLMDFTWAKLADWYLEVAKAEKDKDDILIYLLKNILLLWHPFIPFVTEEIWNQFSDDLLIIQQWPESGQQIETDYAQKFSKLQAIIAAIRNARSENKVEPSRKIKALIYGHEQTTWLIEQRSLIAFLKTGLAEIEIKTAGPSPEVAITITVGEIEIYLLGAIDEEKEKQRLIKEQENLKKMINSLEQRLQNAEFVTKAPQPIIAAERAKLENYKIELFKINSLL